MQWPWPALSFLSGTAHALKPPYCAFDENAPGCPSDGGEGGGGGGGGGGGSTSTGTIWGRDDNGNSVYTESFRNADGSNWFLTCSAGSGKCESFGEDGQSDKQRRGKKLKPLSQMPKVTKTAKPAWISMGPDYRFIIDHKAKAEAEAKEAKVKPMPAVEAKEVKVNPSLGIQMKETTSTAAPVNASSPINHAPVNSALGKSLPPAQKEASLPALKK